MMGGLRIKILVMVAAIIGEHTCNADYWSYEEMVKRACTPEQIHNNPWCPTTTVKPSECLNGVENVDCQFGEDYKNKGDYIGGTSQTVSGLTCQAWNVQTPHKHEFGRLGDHNHCRNPDGESGVWCYTTNPDKRWELCDVRECNSCDKGSTKLFETNIFWTKDCFKGDHWWRTIITGVKVKGKTKTFALSIFKRKYPVNILIMYERCFHFLSIVVARL